MDVGVANEMSNVPFAPRPWRELWDDHLWLFEEIERMGFDFIGLQEHFFADDGHGPPATAFAGSLIERTSTIRIGTWLSILPLHHPARLAQEWATLDQLSGGRTFLTVGAGYRLQEYLAHGLNPRTRGSRMEDGIAVLQKALSGEPFSHSGRYWELRDLVVAPPPLQDPYPVWMGARSAVTAERAARHRCHLALGSADPEVARVYRRCLREAGEDPANYRVSLPLSLTVTREDPAAVRARHREIFVHRWTEMDRYAEEYGDQKMMTPRGSDAVEADVQQNEIIGTPEQILATVDGLRTTLGLTDLLTLYPAPGIDLRTEAHQSLQLFADEVLPTMHGWPLPPVVSDH